jgi:hypothetical protein
MPAKKTKNVSSSSKKSVSKAKGGAKTVSKTVSNTVKGKKTVSKVVKGKKTVVKKTVAKKTVAKKTVSKKATVTKSIERKVRSFKVLLPNSEQYAGRFTGLTPYQAANKALSKYYRETKNAKAGIKFSIKESTRGSKRGSYTYTGSREKLETPITYEIEDGRVITKRFKNRLTKVKKAELAKMQAANSSA